MTSPSCLNKKTIFKFANIFAPIEIKINFATTRSSQDSQPMGTFGSDNVIKKCFLNVTSYMLQTCPLSHEVENLAYKCYAFGTCFPTSFPDDSLIHKFHVLTHHVLEKGQRMWTVGMEAE